MMMMKTKKVKLYGEKLRKLNTAIHERDGNCCIICGRKRGTVPKKNTKMNSMTNLKEVMFNAKEMVVLSGS